LPPSGAAVSRVLRRPKAFTLPIVVNLSLDHFLGEGQLGLQPAKMLQVFAIVLVPVALGMLIRNKRSEFALRMTRPVKLGSMLVLALVIFAALSPALLDSSEMSIPVAVYGIVMFFPTGAFAYYLSRRTTTQRAGSSA
jgi:BASS family bile acid:Na+ symporter